MPTKKNIGPRVSDKTQSWLKENFSSISAGAELVLECNRVLYARTLAELKHEFKENELKAIIDVFNAHMLTPFTSGTELELCLNDSISLDGLDKKWQIENVSDFMERINRLTAYESACLEWWANGFWYGGGTDRPERDIDEYVAMLS